MKYAELPDGISREDIEAVLAELHAKKRGESGAPAFEVNNEYFRIDGRKLRVCTEDELFVSLWGPKRLVDEVYARIVERWKARQKRD